MRKLFLLLFAALTLCLPMSAATKTIYCKMAQSWWKADGAAVGAYYWGTGTAPAWPGVRMTPVEGETDLWSIDVDTDKYQNIIFTRVNGSGTVSDWGAKTADLVMPTGDTNLYTITSTSPVWGNPGVTGEWSVYTTSTPDPTPDPEPEPEPEPTPDPEPEPEPEPEPSTGVVYNVTVPAGTHACYIAGEMTGWTQTEMTKVDDTHYTITIAEATEAHKYKYCSGPDWSYVEVTANDGNVADRTYSAADVVAKWAAVYNPSVEPEPAKDITIKAQIPAAWTNTITAWVWYVGESGKEVTLTKDGDWYVHTENCPGLNIIIKNGEGWTGDANQTVDMTFSEDACIAITAGSGKATYAVVDCEGGVTPAAYYVVGSFNGWTNPDPATLMTAEGGVYTKTLALEAGDHMLKVTNGTWEYGGNWGYEALPEIPAGITYNIDGNIVFTLAEAGDVKVTFNGTNVTVAGNFYVSTPTPDPEPEPEPEPTPAAYYVVGTFNNWTNPDPATVMTEEGGVYTKILTLEAGVECQIKVTNGTWNDGGNWGYDALTEVPAGVTRNNDGNIVFTLAEAGDVKVTFNGTNVTVAGNFYVSTEPIVVTYVLMGVAGDWTTGIELTLNEDNTEDTEYKLIDQAIAEGDAVKVVTLTNGTATAWCGIVEEGSVEVTYDEMGNIVLAPGVYDFYFKPGTESIYIGGEAYPTEKQTYTITATANPAEAGEIHGAGEYRADTIATLHAVANHGYRFVNWTVAGEEVSTEATYSFEATADVEVVANFRATTILVQPGEAKLNAAVQAANAGDTLVLVTGEYVEPWSYNYNKEGLVIMAKKGEKPVVKASSYMKHYATVTFIGITFDGQNTAEYTVYSYENTNKNLTFKDCEFTGYTYYNICQSSSSHVDSLIIDNCLFKDNGYATVYYTNPASGVITCSYLKMTNTTICNVGNPNHETGIIDIREGVAGANENEIIIDHVTIYNFMNPAGYGAIMPYKSGNVVVSNSIVMNPEATNSYAFRAYKGVEVVNTLYFNCKPKTDANAVYTNCLNVDPLFVDAANGNFELQPLSPARGAATDGSDLGDPRWYTSVKSYTVSTIANPAEAGTVTGAGEYTEGKEVTLVATPEHGYQFVNWTIDSVAVSTSATYTFTPTDDVEVVANFEEKSFTGNIINIEPGEFTLSKAIKAAEPGDMIVLADGEYNEEWSLKFDKAGLIIKAAEGANPVVKIGSYSQHYATTTIIGIVFDGKFNEEKTAEHGIYSYENTSKSLTLIDCEIKNVRKYIISTGSDAHIDSLVIDGCLLHDCGAAAIYMQSQSKLPDNLPVCSYFSITNSTVYNVLGIEYYGAIDIEEHEGAKGAGGTEVVIDHVTLYNFATPQGGIRVHKSPNTSITNTIVANPTATVGTSFYVYGGKVSNSLQFNSEKRSSSSINYENITTGDPMFVDAANGNFNLLEGSPAIAAATDGKNIGDTRWVVSAPALPTTYTVAVSAKNGTVSGLENEGVYEAGTQVTLNATADFDYNFVNWTVDSVEVSTEATYTFTIEADVELVANFAEVQSTTVAESGVFTIGKNKTAVFATGNLQYNVGTDTWRFAKQQYQVVGEQNINLGDSTFIGWIDMLGWSNGDENNYGVNPSNVNELYDGEFVDWGTKMGAEWSTLSADDWKYLLNERANAAALKQVAKVDTMVGLLLFPDAWTMPEGIEVEAAYDEYFEINVYNYTLAQWVEMEAAGAMFLPAAGRRTGGYGNMINYDQVEETDPEKLVNGGFYRWHDNLNDYCYYWTSTINEEKDVSYLNNIVALGNDEYTIGTGAIWGEKGRYGQSVRLAKVTETPETLVLTYNLTEEATINRNGTYIITAEEDKYMLYLYGYNGVGEYTGEAADWKICHGEFDWETVEANVVVTLDEENQQYVYAVSATSTDGMTVYNVTINIALAVEPELPEGPVEIMITYAQFYEDEGTMYIEGENDDYSIFLYTEEWSTIGYGDYEAWSIAGFIGETEVVNMESAASIEKDEDMIVLYAVLNDGNGVEYHLIVSGFAPSEPGEGGGTGTDLEDILVGEKAAKVMMDGKLVIIKNGKAYNAMGQEI